MMVLDLAHFFSLQVVKSCEVPMSINSVLIVFRLSLFIFNHLQTFAKAERSSSFSC